MNCDNEYDFICESPITTTYTSTHSSTSTTTYTSTPSSTSTTTYTSTPSSTSTTTYTSTHSSTPSSTLTTTYSSTSSSTLTTTYTSTHSSTLTTTYTSTHSSTNKQYILNNNLSNIEDNISSMNIIIILVSSVIVIIFLGVIIKKHNTQNNNKKQIDIILDNDTKYPFSVDNELFVNNKLLVNTNYDTIHMNNTTLANDSLYEDPSKYNLYSRTDENESLYNNDFNSSQLNESQSNYNSINIQNMFGYLDIEE